MLVYSGLPPCHLPPSPPSSPPGEDVHLKQNKTLPMYMYMRIHMYVYMYTYAYN